MSEEKIPIIDISPLVANANSNEQKQQVVKQIEEACKKDGFFYIVGHGVDKRLEERLERLSKQFFDLNLDSKLSIQMSKSGKALRGYIPLGSEVTLGRPDMKEGIFFGQELESTHPLVIKQTPFHGPNYFPSELPEFRTVVLEYMDEIKRLGNLVLEGIALSLGLEASYFYDRYTKNPLQMFQIFHYPKVENPENLWGVGEHTDFGLLTILKQDNSGGLQVKSGRTGEWIEAPPVDDSFICNIGDMLDRMTGGVYKSTPHRVKCQTKGSRFSYPFFLDPNFHAEVKPIEGYINLVDDREERWDKSSVHAFSGTYGDYLMTKYWSIFPQLFDQA